MNLIWMGVALAVMLAANLLGIAVLLWLLREFRDGARGALQNVQVQLAFIAGRIGLDKRDLDRATSQAPEPDLPTEVIGTSQWADWDEEAYAGSAEATERSE